MSDDGQNSALQIGYALQRIASNIRRVATSVLSAVPLAALIISLASLSIAYINWRYQRASYATQVINNMVQSFGRPVEQEGIECMELVTSMDASEPWWKRSYIPIPAEKKDDLCFANYSGRDADDARGRYARRQIVSRLNNFDTAALPLRANLIDAAMLCEALEGLMREPRLKTFISREVAIGKDHGQGNYPGIYNYYCKQPCKGLISEDLKTPLGPDAACSSPSLAPG